MKPISYSKFKIRCSAQNRGALLIELLVSISILAMILAVGSESVYVSMQSGKISSESDVAIGLASETLEAARSISDERWQNIYDLTKNSNYYPVILGSKWATSTGSEIVTLNGTNYTRSFVVQNVCRNTLSRDIMGIADSNGVATTCVTSGGAYDPSTLKVSATISWQGSGSPVSATDFFSRWKNKACAQADWTGGSGSSGAKTCPDTTYVTSTNIATGTTLQLCAVAGC